MKPNRSAFPFLIMGLALFFAQAQAVTVARSLTVSVRIDSDNQQNGQGVDAGAPAGRVRAKVYGSEQSGSRSSVQQVGVIEGGQASISVGQSILLPLHWVQVGPTGTFVSESVVVRDLGAGFTVTPRIRGQQVQVEISLRQDLPSGDPMLTRTDRLSTTITGPLGQWIHVGGSVLQEGGRQAGVIAYGTHAGSSSRQMWLRVDPVP